MNVDELHEEHSSGMELMRVGNDAKRMLRVSHFREKVKLFSLTFCNVISVDMQGARA